MRTEQSASWPVKTCTDGDVYEFLSVDDREERDGTGWSRNLGHTPRELQQKNTGNNFQSAACTQDQQNM